MRSQAEIMCRQTALGGSRERLPMKLSPCVQKGAWHSVPRRTYLLERLGTASQPPPGGAASLPAGIWVAQSARRAWGAAVPMAPP